jgi:hypothetical protein
MNDAQRHFGPVLCTFWNLHNTTQNVYGQRQDMSGQHYLWAALSLGSTRHILDGQKASQDLWAALNTSWMSKRQVKEKRRGRQYSCTACNDNYVHI